MVSPYVVYIIWYGLQCILKCQVCQMQFYVLKAANNKMVYCVCAGFSKAQSRHTRAMSKAWMGEVRSSPPAGVPTAAELNWTPITIHHG